MVVKRIFFTLLTCVVLTSSLNMYAGAVKTDSTDSDARTWRMERASNRFSMDIPANTLAKMSRSFSLQAGEEVTITASYSPRSASLDFGIISPDGMFYSVNVTDGSVNDTFEVDQRGSYTLAVRNNSSQMVNVSGYVNY